MTILFAITAAIIGALFWVGRRRYYYPVIVSDNTSEIDVIAGDVDGYCDDGCDEVESYGASDNSSGGGSDRDA